jgi:hypothetical protein
MWRRGITQNTYVIHIWRRGNTQNTYVVHRWRRHPDDVSRRCGARGLRKEGYEVRFQAGGCHRVHKNGSRTFAEERCTDRQCAHTSIRRIPEMRRILNNSISSTNTTITHFCHQSPPHSFVILWNLSSAMHVKESPSSNCLTMHILLIIDLKPTWFA